MPKLCAHFFPLAHFSKPHTKTLEYAHRTLKPRGLCHPLDSVTNLKYKLLYFLTPNKKKSKRKALAFNWDRCCRLAICLWLILFQSPKCLIHNLCFLTFALVLRTSKNPIIRRDATYHHRRLRVDRARGYLSHGASGASGPGTNAAGTNAAGTNAAGTNAAGTNAAGKRSG